MTAASNVIKFPTPKRIAKREQWKREWEGAVDYHAHDLIHKSSLHKEWWDSVLDLVVLRYG